MSALLVDRTPAGVAELVVGGSPPPPPPTRMAGVRSVLCVVVVWA